MKNATKSTAAKATKTKATKAAKPKVKSVEQKMVERVFNANNESIDYFRTRLTSNAIAINTLFIKNKKRKYSMFEIVNITKLRKVRVRAHLYWLSKTFDHCIRHADNTYQYNAKSKCMKNVETKIK